MFSAAFVHVSQGTQLLRVLYNTLRNTAATHAYDASVYVDVAFDDFFNCCAPRKVEVQQAVHYRSTNYPEQQYSLGTPA